MDADRCLDDLDPDFKYTNANDSHSWLLNYPEKLKPEPNALKISSMRETFTTPEICRPSAKGKRKKLVEAFYRKVISEDVLARFDEEKVFIEEYKTDYMENFQNPDDMPLPGEICSKNEKLKRQNKLISNEASKEAKLEELKVKYPLYLSAPLTFTSQITGKGNFRKNSTITKRPEENYDNIEY